MIRPAAFGFNPETASSNGFQQSAISNPSEVLATAQHEFDVMAELLESHDIRVEVWDDTTDTIKPDAVFPNNWISFHEGGEVVLYPMEAPNRRAEVRQDVVAWAQQHFAVREVIDLRTSAQDTQYLEGTGSIVFDHRRRVAYACRSSRTSETLFHDLCTKLSYRPLLFDAVDENNVPVYHTNVLMSIGSRFAVVCLDAIRKEDDQDRVLDALAASDLKVVAISYAQMRAFAGNMLEVQTRTGSPVVVVSRRAMAALLPGQIDAITRFAEMLPVAVDTIETYGGGSVRCMLAGVHLPHKTSAH